jgi:polysaccharide biosynthesis protein PslH
MSSALALAQPKVWTRPRVLFLTCHLPWPPVSGGRRRELELIKRLSARFDVHLVATSKTIYQDRCNVPALQRICHRVEVFPVAWPERDERNDPLQVRRHRCPAVAARVNQILAREPVDLVHVEGFYLMQHLPDRTRVPVLLVEQNVEYDLERQRRAVSSSPHSARARLECHRTREVELACWRRATRLAAVTPEDHQMMDGAVPDADVGLVPDGADHLPRGRSANVAPSLARPTAPLLVFVANFAYAPNVDAAAHLVNDILPRIRRTIPDVHLWLVGDKPPHEVRALENDRVRVTGRVRDVTPYVDAADVVVCPLRIGGGIKVKAIEALRRGKALVCSSVGAQGLAADVRDAVLIADDPQSFAGSVAGLLRHPGRRAELERQAAQAAISLPTWDEAARALGAIYDELLEAPVPARRELAMVGGLA